MAALNENQFLCPYCSSANEMSLDESEGREYEMVTDCEICCRPVVVHVRMTNQGAQLDARAENA